MKSNFFCFGLLVLSSCLCYSRAQDKDKRLFLNIGGNVGAGFQFLFAPPPNPPPPPPPAIVPVPVPPPSNRAVTFKKFEGAVDKQGAIDLCAKNGGRLAKIYNQKEQAAILALKLTAVGYFFDLTRVGANNYRFSDNSAPQERIFGPNQPDGSGDCMHLWNGVQYQWDDLPCTLKMGGAICEYDSVGADCSCSASGDPHFQLFDGQWIHFYGICKYTLAKYSGDSTCSFDVEIKNERRFGNPGPSYVRLVDVKIFGKVFRLHQARALYVDGKLTKGGYNDGSKAQVLYGGNKLTFVSQDCGLTVTYDGVAMVSVKTSGKYRSKLSGMCGNCDGIANDYRTQDGKDVSSDPQKYNLVGNSWITRDDSDIPLASCQPPEPVPDNPCRSAQDLTAILGSKFCGIENGPQGAFQTCVKSGLVSVQDWKASCQADLCFNVNDPIVLNKVKCQIIQSFVDLCNQKGINNIIWREFYNCPMTCGNNQVYSSNTSPCPLTCSDVKNGVTTRSCPNLAATEGCQCNAGFVLDGTSCVPTDNCKPSYKPPSYDDQCLNIIGNNAWQDSIDFNGSPQRAADGKKDQNYYSNSCSHTLSGPSHWWAVSFDQLYSFNNVRITNRQDCCSDRLNDIKVYVSNQPTFDPANPLDGATECMSYHTDGAPPSVLNLWSDTPCTGYFGIISQVKQGGILTLCEVEFCTKTKPVETTYVKFDIQIEYDGADAYCKARGGRLAKIKTDPIYKAVLGLGLTSVGYWFDLKTTTPKGTFKCSDGSQPSISPWGPTQPDGSGLCGWLWRVNNYKWDDAVCSLQAGCICEFDKPYTEPPPCTCTASGDPHFQLFDGQWVHYYGICKYTMAKYSGDSTCAYSVEVKLERRHGNPGPSYIRQTDVKIFGKTFRLHQGRKLFVDGKQVASYDDGSTARVFTSGTFLVFKSQKCDLTVQWDGLHLTKITTAGRYGPKLSGICGNCDYKKNDYVTKDGVDVSGKPNVYNLIGDSYAVPDDSDAPTASCKPADPVPPQICAKKEDLTMIQGPLYCGVDSSSSGKIQECVKSGRVAVQEWQTSCIADLCFNAGDPVALNKVKCDSVKAFIDLCAQSGFTGIAWRDIYKCPYTCGNNMVYSPSVNPCPLTCADLRNGLTARDCPDLQSTEGCQCNDGFALDTTNCVPVAQCKPGPPPTRPPVDPKCINLIGNDAWQDSVDFGGNPQRAVDGNKNQAYYGANSCSHTGAASSHWWAVSFDAQYTFNNVRIWNRVDCCTERLNNFKVYASNVAFFDPSNPLDGAVECLSYSSTGSIPQFFDLWSDAPCTGSFLIISMVNNGQPLTLCEVEVCNKDRPKQTNYVKFDVQVTGDNAITFCANKGGRLAQVYTDADHKAVKALGLTAIGYYFALVTKGTNTYQYPDGTKPTVYPWGKNALDQSGTCTQYWNYVGYDWDDVDCNLKLGAICEFTKPYTEPPPCTCSAAGDPHFQLFDGQWIHYYGICKYTLAKYDGDSACKFDVEIKNERRFNNPGPSYVRLVDVKIFGKVFRLHQARQLLVDGKAIKTYDDGWNARVFISGTNLVFQSDKCGLTVSFDGNSVVTVKLEGRYSGKVNGMCGNCDRKQNDYVTKDGTNVAGKPNVYNLIGDSWQVRDDSDIPIAQCQPADPPPPEACPDPTIKANVEGPKACGVDTGAPGKLMDCVKSNLINIDQWKASCIADLCFNANDQVAMNRVKCDIIKALVDLCAQKGFIGIDWRPTYNCPLPCGNNMQYAVSTNPCPVTCTDLRNGVTARSCPDLPQVEGCQCQQGFVLDQRNCVPNDQCKPGPVPSLPPQDPQCVSTYGNDVWQDSIGWDGAARRAIDGNTNPDYGGNSCSHTEVAGKHWWVVSFDGLYTFNNVLISNRKDFTDRLNNFKIMTSQLPVFDPSNPFNGMTDCYSYSVTGSVPLEINIPISKTCTGTFAMIYLDNNNNPLTLCEVKFCNKPLPTPPPGIPPPPSTIARVPRLTPCSCSAVGDPHIKTFDGAFIHHFGTCKYTLAAYNGGPSDPCNFNVETKNENRFGNTGPSYVRLVDVKMFGKTYRLHQDRKLLINGVATAVPYADANVNIDSISGLLTFKSDKCDVTVSFNGVANAFVDVAGKYAYLLTGICGNCDSIQNEFRTKDGKDVSSDKNKNNLVGDSWQVPDDSDTPSATCNPAPAVPDTPCSTAAQKEIVSASNVCGFDKVDDPGIAACFASPKINIAEFKKSCEMDYCLNMNSAQIETIRCEIIAGVIDECYKAGFTDLNWRAYYDCAMDCGYDREYQTLVNPCPVTCQDAANGITTKSCPNAVKRDGCACFEGYYPDGDECKETFLCDKKQKK